MLVLGGGFPRALEKSLMRGLETVMYGRMEFKVQKGGGGREGWLDGLN